MKLIQTKCPQCGASMVFNATTQRVICEYCGMTLLVDEGITSVKCINAEEAGYNFEKGRIRARAELAASSSPVVHHVHHYEYSSPELVEEKKTPNLWWLWLIGWLVVFPLPATILILRAERMGWFWKFVLIIGVWEMYLQFIGVAS